MSTCSRSLLRQPHRRPGSPDWSNLYEEAPPALLDVIASDTFLSTEEIEFIVEKALKGDGRLIRAASDRQFFQLFNYIKLENIHPANPIVPPHTALNEFESNDPGVGIEPKEAQRLFEKFVRGREIARIAPNGSGLGLFIAKKIVDAHEGRIWVESAGGGKGSTFFFEIPTKVRKTVIGTTPAK